MHSVLYLRGTTNCVFEPLNFVVALNFTLVPTIKDDKHVVSTNTEDHIDQKDLQEIKVLYTNDNLVNPDGCNESENDPQDTWNCY